MWRHEEVQCIVGRSLVLQQDVQLLHRGPESQLFLHQQIQNLLHTIREQAHSVHVQHLHTESCD